MDSNIPEVAVALNFVGEPQIGVLLNSTSNFIVLSVTLTIFVNTGNMAFIWSTQQMESFSSLLTIHGDRFGDLCIETFSAREDKSQISKTLTIIGLHVV